MLLDQKAQKRKGSGLEREFGTSAIIGVKEFSSRSARCKSVTVWKKERFQSRPAAFRLRCQESIGDCGGADSRCRTTVHLYGTHEPWIFRSRTASCARPTVLVHA
ncbi:hypothetical protein PHSY_005727 [Pseudozyma hubeiensis SY62]|uniref:Uncharacterized protein n=1 Tax=Pseudozyma hubeiensis (strain SY62) TaxID=1305764 RepID=R9P9S3_PSEHS|nr:hypothetical protein PHSY_005727 [Pseudozyma hubeiensis SY62]GAC98138.1 hypothetical protein PHSY_005727 [Pseudozyma hubeiensis SY62]